MARLRPSPIAVLSRRLFRELSEKNAAFDLPARKFVRGQADLDLSVAVGAEAKGADTTAGLRSGAIFGGRAAVPFGPAAGPHTQLAQNIVLSWLAGGRAIELKTVQIDDDLSLPRPCIDMREIGYNCEFSQELRVPESVVEYAKGALLIAMLVASGKTGVLPSFTGTVFDASVGYDLAGIRSPKVDAYLRALCDVGPALTLLRAELPADLRPLADGMLDARPNTSSAKSTVSADGVRPRRATVLADTVTLSTFHGTPPHEIEAIAEHLMTRYGFAVVVKLNPTLLGERDLGALLHDALGYTDIAVPKAAFERDPTAAQAFEMVGRLRERARALGVRFGVKLTNTLVVENRRPFFPSSVREAYLSGPPLHVLAMHLVARFREALGMDLPLSFSAGIDAQNAADAIALDLVPVTVCTDWLKTGGYGRGIRLHEALAARVRSTGATTREGFILRAFGNEERALADIGIHGEDTARFLAASKTGDLAGTLGAAIAERWVQAAARRNTISYVERLATEPRYSKGHHEKPPRKVGSQLVTFDCLTCDKCVAVCPNDALFTYVAPHLDVPSQIARRVPSPVARRTEKARGAPYEVGAPPTEIASGGPASSAISHTANTQSDPASSAISHTANTYSDPASSAIAHAANTHAADARFTIERTGTVRIEERHQIASFSDHCNDCGNCDAFCPEDGGPYRTKPRFFGSLEALREDPHGEGYFVVRSAAPPGSAASDEPARSANGYRAHVRSAGREVIVESDGVRVHYRGEGFDLFFDVRDPEATLSGEASSEVDLTLARVTHVIATSVLSPREVNPVTAMQPEGAA